MKLLQRLDAPQLSSGCVTMIGHFDGLTLEHQRILQQLVKQAKSMNKPSLLILIELKNDSKEKLSSLREKLIVLQQTSIDYIYCLRTSHNLFTANFHYVFMDEALPNSVGKQLKDSSFPYQYFTTSEIFLHPLIAQGNLEDAKHLLGRSYTLCGHVIYGNQMGRQWGIPTANIGIHKRKIPLRGVFCVEVARQDNSRFKGVANVGSRPTVDGLRNVLEVHLLNFNDNLYGEILQVKFLHKLRDEIKFPNVDALVAQIHHDIAEAIKFHSLDSNS